MSSPSNPVDPGTSNSTEPGNGSTQADPTVDLDQFLNTGAGDPAQAAQGSRAVTLPEADRIVIVGILADDSGSIRNSGLERAVIDGLKLSVDAFRGAKGSDFALDVRGFKRSLFCGMLKDAGEHAFDGYAADFDHTPLVAHAGSFLRELHAKAEQYRNMGIPVTVALLLVTDGLPYCDSEDPEAFTALIAAGDYVVGMGIGDDEHAVAKFSALFKAMGIAKVMTPKAAPAEVRHAINQFSQSVASIAAA
jgi:hypothetical protein